MSYYVYIHTCPNNKRYIGITTRDLKKRWRNGKGYKTNKHFYSAIQIYGWINIDHKIFEVDTKGEMYYLEKYLISYYQSNKSEFGYNNSSGGEKSSTGCHFRCSEDKKIKISNSLKGHSGWNKGMSVSEETRIKMSDAKKGIKKGPHTEEYKRMLSIKMKGIKKGPFTEEHKRKLSEAHKGRKRIYNEDGTYHY